VWRRAAQQRDAAVKVRDGKMTRPLQLISVLGGFPAAVTP
jgi:hypothetical protein